MTAGRYSKVYKESESSSLRNTGVAPTTVEPWIIEQFQKMARGKWVVRELEKKADDDWVKEKFRSIERRSEDTQSVIKEHKGKLSNAPKRHEMNDLKEAVTGWSYWFRRMMVGAILFLIGTGGMIVWQYAGLNAKVEMSSAQSTEMVEMMKELKKSQEDLEDKFSFFKDVLEKQMMLRRTTTDNR